MELNTNKLADGRTMTSLHVTKMHDRERAEKLARKLNGYMIDRVVVAPYRGELYVTVESCHEDAPTELVGFVMMILASEAARN